MTKKLDPLLGHKRHARWGVAALMNYTFIPENDPMHNGILILCTITIFLA